MQETQRGEASAEGELVEEVDEEEEEDEDEEDQRLAFIDRSDLNHRRLREVLEMPMRLQEVLAPGIPPGRRLAVNERNHTGGGRGASHKARNHTRAAARTSLPARDHSLKASRKISPDTSPQTSPTVRPAPKTPTKTAPRMFRGAVQPSGGRTHLGVLLGLGVGNGDDTDTGHTAS